jgi:hemoglobin
MNTDQDVTGAEQGTLYERIGGAAGVATLIDRFYDKVVADPELAPFFLETPMDKLRAMQREFFAAALDGPQSYSGLSLSAAHSGRGITPRHFSRYVACLLETLAEIGVPPRDMRAVVDRIATYSDDITGGTAEAG